MDAFREGARVHDPLDICPGCSRNCIHFASDFRAFGRHKIRVCLDCRKVFENEKPVADLTIAVPPDATA